MIEQIFIAILLGICAGVFTGLVPGIHINLIAMVLFLLSPNLLQITTPLILASFIISMSITHCFLDFIPSIFLGVPDEATALSILPGHRMLIEGNGYAAIKLTTIGCFFGVLIAFALTPFFVKFAPLVYPFLNKCVWLILIFIAIFLILREEKKVWGLFIFGLSGILGLATLNCALIKQPLFPLFSGLFGTSMLTLSFIKNVKIPSQKIQKIEVEKKEMVRTFGLGIVSSTLVSFLPGIGAAQAAAISSIIKKFNEKTFLLILGVISTLTMCLSFVALYSIQKPRSGVAVFVGKFLPFFTLHQLIFLLVIAIIAASLSVFLSLFFAKIFVKIIKKVNYKWLCFNIIIFILLLSAIISKPLSLLVIVSGTAIGLLTSLLGVKKIQMMGSLLLPVILWHITTII